MAPNNRTFRSVLLFVFMAILVSNIPTSVHGATTKSDGFNSNRSQARLVLMLRNNSLHYRFYSVGSRGQADKNNTAIKLDDPSYALPEPGCSCVPRIQDCDFDCCYCKLNCPLPRSRAFTEDWLTPLYGNGCENRKPLGLKKSQVLSIHQRRDFASKKLTLVCERPDYSPNAQMTLFPFICLHLDKSYTSLQYGLKPSRQNHLRMTNHGKAALWPVRQRFYNNCKPAKDQVIDKEPPSELFSKEYYLSLRARQLFHLEPPPGFTAASIKGAGGSYDKLCLSQRRNPAEILTIKSRGERKSVDILEKAIENFGQRKINYLANLKLKLPRMTTSCQQYRNELAHKSKEWIKKLTAFAQGNESNPQTNIPIMRLEPENLSAGTRQRFQNESFPHKCYNVQAGIEVFAFFSQDIIFNITYRTFLHDIAAKSSPPFFIQIKSLSPTKVFTPELSRFWSDFMYYECPDQYCWRDLLALDHLLADPVLISAVFVALPIVSVVVFANVGFYNLI